MKKFLGLVLVAALLAGCAGKAVMEDQAAQDVPPAVAEPAPPVAATEPPAVVQEAPAPAAAEVQKPAAEPAAMKVFFDFDSSLLTPESQAVLTADSLWLQAQPEVRIVLAGYTDERGSDSYNLALGEKRAKAARDYLVNLGVAPDRIDIISYGEEKAARAANDEAIWAKDRRAEIVRKD